MLARDCHRSLALVLAEVDSFDELDEAYGRTATHETVVQAANTLRQAVGEKALVARTGLGRFAVLDWDASPDQLIGNVQSQLAMEHQSFAFVFGQAAVDPDSDDSIPEALRTAELALCENKLASSNLP
mgnify:CR=1 FL=1